MKTKKQIKSKKNIKDVKYYVMFGFEENDPNNTAYLRIDKDANEGRGIYSIVKSIKQATKFTNKNINDKIGFGTHEQWARFFAQENEISDWNFHPISFKVAKEFS